MKGSIIMNTELNNAIVKNKKVYAENEEATHTNIKTLDDVIAAMDKLEKDMVWDKLCSCENKLDKILKILGDK